ncbi:stage III sporulation protein AB [Abyssisolibacter fermentans]|uniref:stage III sporulation protein AB n=1 Tax=Abyssisolibacter fermentans TaxID=1766203 RepID=UPI00083769AE|nr:stage III sporulation protein AB [Abyssisolibacter fermentans]
MLIIKILGSLMVVISCSIFGFNIGTKYRIRVNNLNYLLNCIRILETEIVYMSNPVNEALHNIYSKCNKSYSYIFRDIAIMLEDEDCINVANCFKIVGYKNFKKLAFNSEDIEIFLSIGSILGTSDRQDQKKHLNAISVQIINQLKEAKEEMKKNEKLYNKLGILTGLSIAIILF